MAFTTRPVIDQTNTPWKVFINNFRLPDDVMISFNGEKVIAESKILDGAYVFERVGRKPVEINFDFTIRETDPLTGAYIFGADTIYDYWANIWQIDSIVPVLNTFLNKIGINNLIVKSINVTTIRGNTNIPVTLKCHEMAASISQQKSLIVPLDFTTA